MITLAQSPNSPQTAPVKISPCVPDTLPGWKAGSILNDKIRYALLNELRDFDTVRGIYLHKGLKLCLRLIYSNCMKGNGCCYPSSENIYYTNNVTRQLEKVAPETWRRWTNRLAQLDLIELERAYKLKKNGGGNAPSIAIPKGPNGERLNWHINDVRKLFRLARDGKKRGRKRQANSVGRPKKSAELTQKSPTVAPAKKLPTIVHQMNVNRQVYRTKRSYSKLIRPKADVTERAKLKSGPFALSSLDSDDLLKMVKAPRSRQDVKEEKAQEKPSMKIWKGPSVKNDASDYNPNFIDSSDYEQSLDPENDTHDKRIDRFAEKPADLGVDPTMPILNPLKLEDIPEFGYLQITRGELIDLRRKFEYFDFTKDRIQINANHAIFKIRQIKKANAILIAQNKKLKTEICNPIAFISDCIRHDKAQWLWEPHINARKEWFDNDAEW